MVVKLDLRDSKREKKVVKALSKLAGVESVTADLKDGNITVVGDGVDPILAVSKLRRLFGHAQLVSFGEVNKDDTKVEEVTKHERKHDGGSQEADESGARRPPFKLTLGFLQRRSEEHTSELQSRRLIAYAGFGV